MNLIIVFLFGFRGKWHGEVAVKMLNIDMNDDEQLQAFKTEVSSEISQC